MLKVCALSCNRFTHHGLDMGYEIWEFLQQFSINFLQKTLNHFKCYTCPDMKFSRLACRIILVYIYRYYLYPGVNSEQMSDNAETLLTAAETEKVGRWKRTEGERTGPLPSYAVRGCHPRKIYENIGANLCNLVNFWRPVQQKMHTSSLI